MEGKKFSFGTSLLVPSVQELAKEPLITVPPRYVRSTEDEIVISEEETAAEIPVIDMKKLLSDEQIASDELARFDKALQEWGFFQVINHGVSPRLIEQIKMEIEKFFRLPMEEKKPLWQDKDEVEGFGQVFVVSEEQKLDWCDMFFMTTLPLHKRKPHLFPDLPSSFRNSLETYSKEMEYLAMTIFGQMEKALKIEKREMKKMLEDGMQSVRINYYPPCPNPEKVIGISPHSDGVALTILLQISDVEGLQVKNKDKWVPIKPLPDAFIVNVGDFLEIITNGIYKSIEHRATVNNKTERISMATFCHPCFEGEVGPARSLISDQTPAMFSAVKVEEFYKGLLAHALEGKSFLDTHKIR